MAGRLPGGPKRRCGKHRRLRDRLPARGHGGLHGPIPDPVRVPEFGFDVRGDRALDPARGLNVARHSGVFWLAWTLVGVLVLATWLAATGPDGSDGLLEEEVAARGGSAEPCAVPLGWRIGDIDPRFGVSEAEAERAMVRAVEYWEEVAGRTLFRRDADEGLPVRFVFDERQAVMQERSRRAEELDAIDARLDTRRAQLDRAFERLNTEVGRHNEWIREWNERGGAPPEVLRQIEETQASIAMRERELTEQAELLNRDVRERNRFWESLREEFPARTVESAYYGEQVRFRRGRVSEVTEREIRIYYFDDREELVLLLAHELGHALGLGHTEATGAVMSEVHTGPVPALHPSDVELLRGVCPQLVN
ncbi:MAG: hypothetical protein EA351_12900 [Gemmatimonadales bacterium]|nr:MAG: hypothetical protein EA351_12900 [Gemmatimonadales bacterium]